MKKLLSGVLALGMLISNMTFSVAEAAETTPDYAYSDMKLSGIEQRKYNVFLSETGTPEANASYPWFEKGYAIDLTEMKKSVNEEGIWVGSRGTPYSLNLTENGKGAGSSGTINYQSNYYSKIKVLVAQPSDTQYACSFGYSINDGVQQNYSNNWSNYAGNSLGTIKLWKITNGKAEATEEVGELWEYTITLSDTAKATKTNKLYWTYLTNGYRVLGVTGVGLTGAEWKPLIEKELAVLSSKPDDTKLAEIKTMVDRAKAGGVDIMTIAGIDKYLSWTAVPEYAYSSMVNGGINLRQHNIFLSKEGKPEINDTTKDWFGVNESCAVDLDDMKKYVDDNDKWISSKGIPYELDLTEKGKGWYGGITTTLPKGYYSEIWLLVVFPEADKESSIQYSLNNGSSAVQGDSWTWTTSPGFGGHTVKKLKINNNTVTETNQLAETFEYKIIVSKDNQNKPIDNVWVNWASSTTQPVVIGVTGRELLGDEWKSVIEEKITALPESAEEINIAKFDEITAIIEKAQSQGLNVSTISNIEKYNTLKAALEEFYSEWENAKEIVLNVSVDGMTAFTTLEDAKNAVRNLKAAYPDKPIRVIFHEGVYRFDNGVAFDSSDSGTITAPVIYEAAEGERVEFKGSKEIDIKALQPISDDSIKNRLKPEIAEKVIEIDLTKSGITSLEEFISNGPNDTAKEPSWLYMNEKEQPVAQYPNGEGEYSVWDTVIEAGDTGLSSTNGGTIKVKEDISRWADAGESYLGGFFGNDYRYERIRVNSINTGDKTIKLATGTDLGLRDGASQRWKIFNLLEELDAPGEWYIDRENLMLYYYVPRDIANVELELSVMTDPFMSFTGTEYVEISDIIFSESRGYGILLYKDIMQLISMVMIIKSDLTK